MELIHAMGESYQGISVFAGIGERSREGHELLTEMRRSGVLDRSVLVLLSQKVAAFADEESSIWRS
jgi:F-type H+-transporting ATPase subunit beta